MKLKCCDNKKYDKDLDLIIELLKTMADENRLKILCLLKTGERCVCDIWQDLDIPQNLASHHLKILKNSGLINSHKMGLKVIYFINKKSLNNFKILLDNFLQNGKR